MFQLIRLTRACTRVHEVEELLFVKHGNDYLMGCFPLSSPTNGNDRDLRQTNNATENSKINERTAEQENVEKAQREKIASIAIDIGRKAKTRCNIASERNQPMELAGRFEELFDTKWRDVMKCTFPGEELKGIRFLSKILQDCEKFCQQVAKQQVAMFVNPCQSEKEEDSNTEQILKERGVDLRELLHLRTCTGQSPTVRKNVAMRFLKDNSEKLEAGQSINDYVLECCDLCWLFTLQDPPISLDFDVEGKQFEEISKRFREYSFVDPPDKRGNSGSVMDVVWPAMVCKSADQRCTQRVGNAFGQVIVFKDSVV